VLRDVLLQEKRGVDLLYPISIPDPLCRKYSRQKDLFVGILKMFIVNYIHSSGGDIVIRKTCVTIVSFFLFFTLIPAQPVLSRETFDSVREMVDFYRTTVVVKVLRNKKGKTQPQASGSGLFVAPTRILTNAHMVGSLAKDITEFKKLIGDADLEDTEHWIEFKGRRVSAKLIWRDPAVDLAILEITKPLSGADVAVLSNDEDNIYVSQSVYVFGNPYGRDGSVTRGMVSALKRVGGLVSYSESIQTDAAINPGNSGGPLVTESGEVIGIVNSKIPAADNMGFAVPIRLYQEIQATNPQGTLWRSWFGVVFPKPGDLKKTDGIRMYTILAELTSVNSVAAADGMINQLFDVKQGVLLTGVPKILSAEDQQIHKDLKAHSRSVSEVYSNPPAYRAGVRVGDIVIRLGSESIKNSRDLMRAIFWSRPFEETLITVIRFTEDGNRKEHIFPITPIVPIPTAVKKRIY
jgi:S1-C subfamily serine protease